MEAGHRVTLAFRKMDALDQRFVTDAWAKSYRESDYAGIIQNDSWFSIMLPQFARIVEHPDVHVTMAYDPSSPRESDLFGWICTETCQQDGYPVPLVYYVFVKSAYRKRGIARALFGVAGIDPQRPFVYACKTYVVDKMTEVDAHRLIPYARFCPMMGRD
jgi:hypothetical protein